tara:strand:+ start:150694 stop:150903 length:210 start_codon:yes stop_codon:yes gene_type:complete
MKDEAIILVLTKKNLILEANAERLQDELEKAKKAHEYDLGFVKRAQDVIGHTGSISELAYAINQRLKGN